MKQTKQKEGKIQSDWMKSLQEELGRVYGTQEGMRISWTVMPGILADFRKMLDKAPAGRTVREEYRMEDGRISLRLEGRALATGSMRKLLVTRVSAGEKVLEEDEGGVIVL